MKAWFLATVIYVTSAQNVEISELGCCQQGAYSPVGETDMRTDSCSTGGRYNIRSV